MSIALAHSMLPSAAIGHYEVLMYVVYLLTFFWVSGAVQALLAYYPQQSAADRAALVFQSFIVFTVTCLLLGGLLWAWPQGVINGLARQSGVPYTSWVALYLATHIPATLQEHYYLLQSRPRAIVAYGAATASAQFLAVCWPLWAGWGLGWSFVWLALLGAAKWLWLAGFVYRHGRVRLTADLLWGWWQVAWPLMAYSLLGTVSAAMGPWLVGRFFPDNPAVFALYRYGARELPLLAALTGAVASTAIPLIAAQRGQGLRQLYAETRRLNHLLFPLGIALMLTSPWWFTWVFTDAFAASVPLFNLFLLLIPVQLLFARSVLVALHDTWRVPWFAAVGIVVQFLLAHLLVPHWGLAGIAVATVLAFLFEKLALAYYLYRRHGVHLGEFTALRWWGIYTAAMLAAYFLAFAQS